MEALEDMDAVIAGGERYTPRVMDHARKLKIIARLGVGHDNVDVRAATERGIYVTWTPIPELAKSVAEEALALILSVLRRIPQMDRHVRYGGYDIEGMAAHVLDLYPRTLGILGLGRIGLELFRIAKGFGMNIQYYDPVRREDAEREEGVTYVAFEELLKTSDIVSIHVPLSDQSRGLIGEREIRMMKPGAIVINTARGPLVDHEALHRALEEGRLGGAGLSVLSQEPPQPGHRFHRLEERLPNVVLTPHIGVGKDTGRTMALTAANDVIAALEGRTPRYLLNPEVAQARGKVGLS